MTNQEEHDAAIRRAFEVKDALRTLAGVVEHLRLIAQREAMLKVLEASSLTNKRQLNRLLTELAGIRRDSYAKIDFTIRDAMQQLEPAADTARLLNTYPLVGTFYVEWLTVAETREAQRVKAAMRMALINKEDAKLLSERITEAYAASKTSLASLVATVGNMVVNEARIAAMKAAGVKQWRITALVDSGTSPKTLASLGEIYDVGKGPHLPLHIGGRSIATPVHEGPLPDLETVEQWRARQATAP
jgi:hypothetical protein